MSVGGSTFLGEALQLSLCGLALIAGTVVVAAAPTSDDHTFFVVFAPWTSQADATVAATVAGASLLGLPALPFVAEVRSDLDDYPGLARAQGAIIVVPARMVRGCALRRVRNVRA